MTDFSEYVSTSAEARTHSSSGKANVGSEDRFLARQIGFGLFSIASAIGALGVGWLILNFHLSWQIPAAIGVGLGLILLYSFDIIEFEPISDSHPRSYGSEWAFDLTKELNPDNMETYTYGNSDENYPGVAIVRGARWETKA